MRKKIVQIRFWPKIQKKFFLASRKRKQQGNRSGLFLEKKSRRAAFKSCPRKMAKKYVQKKKAKKKCPKNMSKKKMPDRIAPKLWASVMVNEQMAKTNARGHWPLQSFSISWPKKLDSLEHVNFLWHFIWAN